MRSALRACRRAPSHTGLATAAILMATGCASSSRPAVDPELSPAGRSRDSAAVAALDERYQNAVKANDAATMAEILADDFALVTGRGTTFTKADLLASAREAGTTYERQDVQTRTVRVWGNTAVVTALLWIKGVRQGQPIDYQLWFSDTYVRTPTGWRYVLGQASLPLPQPSARP